MEALSNGNAYNKLAIHKLNPDNFPNNKDFNLDREGEEGNTNTSKEEDNTFEPEVVALPNFITN